MHISRHRISAGRKGEGDAYLRARRKDVKLSGKNEKQKRSRIRADGHPLTTTELAGIQLSLYQNYILANTQKSLKPSYPFLFKKQHQSPQCVHEWRVCKNRHTSN